MSGVIFGDGPVAAAVRRATGLVVVDTLDAVTDGPVVLALGEAEADDATLTALLGRGIDVISTAHTALTEAQLQEACDSGGATYHHIGLLEFVLSRSVPTALQSLREIREVRLVERRDLPAATADELDRLRQRREQALRRAAADTFGVAPGELGIESERTGHLLECRAMISGRTVYRIESHFDDATDTGTYWDMPGGVVSYALDSDSDPTDYLWQIDLPNEGVVPGTLAGLVADVLPAVTGSGPGVLVEDPAPRYKHDARVAKVTV